MHWKIQPLWRACDRRNIDRIESSFGRLLVWGAVLCLLVANCRFCKCQVGLFLISFAVHWRIQPLCRAFYRRGIDRIESVWAMLWLLVTNCRFCKWRFCLFLISFVVYWRIQPLWRACNRLYIDRIESSLGRLLVWGAVL